MRLSFLLFASSVPGSSGFSVVTQTLTQLQPNAIIPLKARRKSASASPWRRHSSPSHLKSAQRDTTGSPSSSPSPKRRMTKPRSGLGPRPAPTVTKRNWTYSATTITGKWRENFEDLKVYAANHGHTRVPYNYAPNPRLGRWVARQRSLYNEMMQSSPSFSAGIKRKIRPATMLTQERIDALESVGFSFESPRKRTWNKRFDELCTYKALHGDCLVPLQYDAIPGLGIWVRNQRTLYRNILLGRKKQTQSGNDNSGSGNGNPSYLSPEKIAALQSIGFVWDTQRNDQWKKRFDELVDFKAVYGHCSVPEKYHENPSLGAWVVNQRTSYKNFISGGTGGNAHKGPDGIGIEDALSNRSIQIQNSNINLNERSMSQWRANGGKSLTPAKIQALESIGFCWDQNQKNWYAMYERLKQYKAERREQLEMQNKNPDSKDSKAKTPLANNKDKESSDDAADDALNNALFHVPPEDVVNRDLRLWISVQRKEYSTYMQNKNNQKNNDSLGVGGGGGGYGYNKKRSSMTPRRKRALDDIGFPWSLNNKQKYGGGDGPTVDDWTALFEQMREKGIDKNARPKEHWFEGQSLFAEQEEYDEKEYFSDDDLLELWNMEEED